jgi:Ran GTPase-activating protein (RanGAP) involved in mRNA processing and transport
LEVLKLSDNRIGEEGAKVLSEALSNNATLKCLDISSNAIGVIGMAGICNFLAKNTSLEELYVSKNKLDDRIAPQLHNSLIQAVLELLLVYVLNIQ